MAEKRLELGRPASHGELAPAFDMSSGVCIYGKPMVRSGVTMDIPKSLSSYLSATASTNWLMPAASDSSLYGLRRMGNSRSSFGMNCLLL